MLKGLQQLAMERRFVSRQGVRGDHLRSLSASVAGRSIDTEAIEPLARQQERARLMLASASTTGRRPPEGVLILEAVVGRDDRLPRSFLGDGARTGDAVCKITTLTPEGELSFGTGFAVAPGLVMTNNHVLPNAGFAERGLVEFGLGPSSSNRTLPRVALRLDPGEVFLTDLRLDFTIVAFEPGAAEAVHEAFGSISLLPQSGKALIGEAVNIIQHGDGEVQMVSLRDNVVVDVFDDWLHYTSDTSPGASGSPVLNDQWQLASLHHAAFEYVNNYGRRITVNEGVRISSIARRISEIIR